MSSASCYISSAMATTAKEETMTTREKYLALMDAVYTADGAWANDLDNADAKAAYRAAKAEFRAYEETLLGTEYVETCGRCGGAGGWKGWPGFTCYECLGHCKVTREYRKHRFDADPAARDRAYRKRLAEREAEDAAFAAKAAELGAAGAKLVAAADKVNAWHNYREDDSDLDESLRPTKSDYFFAGLADKLRKYGSLSEKQLACVERGLAEDAKKAAEAEALKSAPALTGGVREIEGEVLSARWHDGAYGSTYKMRVKLDDGNVVWGTVPRSLMDATTPRLDHENSGVDEEGRSYTPVIEAPELVGSRVRFTAEVERSRDDEHFGFFRRPKRAVLV